MAAGKKRIVAMSVLPGQPCDGTGQVCIHLFIRDDAGLFIEPHVLHPTLSHGVSVGKLEARPTRGRLACDPKRIPKAIERNGVTHVTARTDDARAVTCLKCRATAEYTTLMVGYNTPNEVK